MKITVLGSGSAFNAMRNPSGYAAQLDDQTLLFDLGFGNLRQLARAKIDPRSLTDAFFTHRHPDHCGDLAALLFLFRYDLKPASGRLRVWGPKGFADFVRRIQEAHAPWCGPQGYALEVHELDGGATVFDASWEIETLSVPHPTPALAYRLTYKGKSFVYSGDTGYCPPLADFAAGADLFLLECASTRKRPMEGHLTPELALATLDASGCRKGVLTHVTDEVEAELRRLRVRPARDLQRFLV